MKKISFFALERLQANIDHQKNSLLTPLLTHKRGFMACLQSVQPLSCPLFIIEDPILEIMLLGKAVNEGAKPNPPDNSLNLHTSPDLFH